MERGKVGRLRVTTAGRTRGAKIRLLVRRHLRRLRRRLPAADRLVRDRRSGLLSDALGHMDQGIMVVRADMTVPLLSRRAAELIGLPLHFAEDPPDFAALLDHQVATGEISAELRNSGINAFILRNEDLPETHVYERETAQGRLLEVRTTRMPEGGFIRTFTDRTAGRRTDRDLRLAHEGYRALFENAVVGLYRSTVEGELAQANLALARLNGFDAVAPFEEAMRNQMGHWYVDPGRYEEFRRRMEVDGMVRDMVSKVRRIADGREIWISESGWALRDETGRVIGYEGSVMEATERIEAEARMLYEARHDDLTGLANRRFFHERIEAALAGGAPLAILGIDLDRFKQVNDGHGHPVGDELLKVLARRFRSQVRDGDLVARVGGDEFAVLLPGADGRIAAGIAARLTEAAARPVTLDDTVLEVGASIGLVAHPLDGSDMESLLKLADERLYAVKQLRDPGRPPAAVAAGA